MEFQSENIIISSVNRVTLLGVHIDSRLDFDHYMSQICKKTSKMLHVLSRVSKYMDITKQRILMMDFIISQFLLVWMFHSRNT